MSQLLEKNDPILTNISSKWDFYSKKREIDISRKAQGPRHVPPPTDYWGPRSKAGGIKNND